MSKIFIRRSKSEDFKDLIEIDHLSWNNANSPQPIKWKSEEEYSLRCPAGSQFVAEIDGKVVGYIGHRSPTPLSVNRHVLEINIAVHPNYGRQGIGKALIRFIESWGKEQGITKLSLRVLETNSNAIKFYKANGYIEQGRLIEEFLIDGKPVDDLLMFKKID